MTRLERFPRKNRRSSGRGFTLPEILIFATIAFIPLALAMNLFVSGSRQNARMHDKVNGLQAVQLTFETIRDDLAQLVAVDRTDSTDTGIFRFERFREFAYDEGKLYSNAEDEGWLRTDTITYGFDPVTHHLERNGRAVGTARFLDAGFWMEGNAVRVLLVLCPEELIARGEEPTPEQKTVLSFRIGLPHLAARSAFSGWLDNWHDRIAGDETARGE